MNKPLPKPDLLVFLDDALDTGADLRQTLRSLEGALNANGMLRPDLHKVLKNYIRVWDALHQELEKTKPAAQRRAVVRRLRGTR